MATETNLTKVNVFSSEAQYNANKNGLGVGELALIPFIQQSGGGGTGVSDVGDNFIQLSNGVIIQWGHVNPVEPKSNGRARITVSFPKPYSTAVYGIWCTKNRGTYTDARGDQREADGGFGGFYSIPTLNQFVATCETNREQADGDGNYEYIRYSGFYWLAIGK